MITRMIVSVLIVLVLKSASGEGIRLAMERPDWNLMSINATENIPSSELEALRDLYDATQGDNWRWTTNAMEIPWNFSDPNANPCADHWQGIICVYDSGEYQNVVHLTLTSHGLNGTLPTSLVQLSRLIEFNVCNNSLIGPIPHNIGNLAELTYLELCKNALTGALPGSLVQLSQLVDLDVSFNNLVGPIPEAIDQLTKLLTIAFSYNSMTGTIPEVLGSLSQLRMLYLQDNELHGTLPSSLGDLTQLVYLDIDTNAFTSTIPETLSNLHLLEIFRVGNNRLTGTLPNFLGSLLNLKYLAIYNNHLHGTVPDSYGDLAQLLYLVLGSNNLVGTVPESLSKLSMLQAFNLGNNSLTGTLPAFIGGYSHLQFFYISNNSLVGSLPESLGNLSALNQFNVARNYLTGTIPHSVSRIHSLGSFIIDHNHITGTLEGIFDPAVHTVLDSIIVNDNQLTGTLPSEIFDLPSVTTVVASTNCFHGQLPDNLCACSTLTSIVFDGLSSAPACKNKILPGLSHSYTLQSSVYGTVPTCLFQLPTLITLHLAGNGFTGSIVTDNIVVSPYLIDMSLSHNGLTGTIPAQLQDKKWAILDLSFNRLHGSLSSALASKMIYTNHSYVDAPDDERMSLSLENNRLSGPIPHSVRRLQNINILGTNLFSCRLDGSDLPQHDSGVSNYQCGSSEFDVPYYLWLGLTCITVALVWYAVRYRLSLQRVVDIDCAINCWEKWSRCVAACGVSSTTDAGADTRVSKLSPYVNIQQYCQVLDSVSKHTMVWTAVIVVVLLPAYAILSHYYGTHQQAYAWTVSAAYLSGAVPFGLELVFWLIIFGLAVFTLLTYCWPLAPSKLTDDTTRNTTSTTASTMTTRQFVLIYVLFMGCNIFIVGGVNVAYVYVSIYRSSQLLIFAQICMSFFKVIYNGVVSNYMLYYTVQYVTREEPHISAYASLRALSALVNNIVIPFVVVMVVSPSCFYNVFTAAPSVNAVFTYEECVSVNVITSECTRFERQPDTSSFDPPFSYSYQCSSSLITYYAPAFVNLCIVSMFVVPITQFLAVEVLRNTDKSTRWYWLLNYVTPTTWKLPELGETMDTTRSYFDPLKEQLAQLNYFALIFTFGVVFPPLAVALAITMIVCTETTKLKLGQLLQHLCDHDAWSFAQRADQACESLLGSVLLRFVGMLSVIACAFYTLFLFDTLGDAVGFHKAYWVLIVVPALPVCFVCAHFALGKRSPLYRYRARDAPAVEMVAISHVNSSGDLLGHGTETYNVMLENA